ncbi:MAG: glycoside hydrolase family 16 protein [Bythopirellula sp.]|nr:glycoside hydrolase family 16 protein [Bythopirellula sp.]
MTPFKYLLSENRSRSLVWLLLAAAVVLSCQTMALAAPDGWTQVWSDEFDGSAVNTTNWRNLNWNTPHNNEQQAYIPQQAAVAGGMLTITATNQPSGGKPYRSARLESNYAKQYGRWEIRAKLPSTKGTWPAIWLLPNVSQHPWPSQGEIDIMENRGQQPNLTSSAFHFRNGSGNHDYEWGETTQARFGQPVNFHDSFHTYAVEWDAKKLRFFIDDINWYTLHDADVGGTISQNAPMETVLNVAVGGHFLGDSSQQPDGTSVWPQQMLVDYVRVYERENNVPRTMTNGDFEANDGSLAGWTIINNEPNTNNVSVHNEAAHGEASLKLFGRFNGSSNPSGISQGITVEAGDEVRADVSRFIRSQDSILGTTNLVRMRIEFYDEFGGKADTAAMLQRSSMVIANGSSANNSWQDFDLTAVAPANAVEARLSLLFSQSNNNGGAVHVDNVRFMNLSLAAGADSNLEAVSMGTSTVGINSPGKAK